MWRCLLSKPSATGTTFTDAFSGSGVWASFWESLTLSYSLAAVVTVLGIALGLPMAILIARKTFGRGLSVVLDTLINVPIIVPSIALGVSLKFFWSNVTGLPEFLLLVFAHLAITYPYFVRSMSAAMERITIDMEEAAKTLGAKPFALFRTIVWPITKYSILSGAIIVFTRSISETGATLAVASKLQTAPVLIVNWVNSVERYDRANRWSQRINSWLSMRLANPVKLHYTASLKAFNQKRKSLT